MDVESADLTRLDSDPPTEWDAPLALAIAIVMQENACGSGEAARLVRSRAHALGVTPVDVANTIVEIGYAQQTGA